LRDQSRSSTGTKRENCGLGVDRRDFGFHYLRSSHRNLPASGEITVALVYLRLVKDGWLAQRSQLKTFSYRLFMTRIPAQRLMTNVLYIISATQAEGHNPDGRHREPRFSRLVSVELLVLVAQQLT
jgi:hypothetical protein